MPSRHRPAEAPDLSWAANAACSRADAGDLPTFTDAICQDEAREVTEVYCTTCAVRAECLAVGRQTTAWGVWGGVVLVDGWFAPDKRPLGA